MSLSLDKQPAENYYRRRVTSTDPEDCSNFRFGTGRPPLFARYLLISFSIASCI